MINAGRYRAKAVQAALGETSTGKPQVGIEFELLDHPGQTINYFGYFTDETFSRTVESLRACGWSSDDLSDLTGIDTNEVSLVVEHEEYDGKTRAKVRWVNRTGGLALKAQMPADKAKAFGAQMKGRIKALGIQGANGPDATGDRPPF
jgi:hypothetical protein